MAKPDRTRQKGLQNILQSDVDIVLACVCYCLRAEQSDHQHPQPKLQRSVVSWTSIVINISVNAIGKLGSANLSQRKHDWYERVNDNWHDLILEVQPTDEKLDFYFALLRPEVKQEVSSSRYEKVEWQSIHYTLCDRKLTSVYLPSSTIFFRKNVACIRCSDWNRRRGNCVHWSLVLRGLSCVGLDIGHSLLAANQQSAWSTLKEILQKRKS